MSQNIVSSLPFLAPVFVRKAKEYRSKQSSGYGSSKEHPWSRGKKSTEHYKLGELSQDKDMSGIETIDPFDSQENIVQNEVGAKKVFNLSCTKRG